MELIIGAIIGIAGLFVGLWAIWYARKSYQIAKKAPIVRVSFYDGKLSHDCTQVPFSSSSLRFKEDGYSEPTEFPLLVENIGRLSARNINLNIRYPAPVKVHSSGDRILHQNDPMLSNLIVVNHKVPDLPPAAQVLIKDSLEIPREFFEGLPLNVKGTLKNGVSYKAKARAYFHLFAECIVGYDDSLPTYVRIELLPTDSETPELETRSKC